MTKLLSIYELNSYSRLVYDNKKSTLDAAFELLLTYSNKITSNIFKNQTATFILYMYTIVYLQLLNDSDNNMLYLSGNNNDFKLFAYNIIYFYDNQNEEYDEYNGIDYQQKQICSSDIFYYIISQYLSNCDIDDNNINNYKTTITEWIGNNYDYEELMESNNDRQPEDWEIYIYVICYNYICLFQDIKNNASVPFYLSNIKNYLNSCIIVYCMNIIIQSPDDEMDTINDFLEENQYFSDIIDSVQAIFYNNNDNDNIDIKFQITNCPYLFDAVYNKEKLLETIFYDVIGYYTYKPSNNFAENKSIIEKFKIYQYDLCKKLNIQENEFISTINNIKAQVKNNNRGSLKQFYNNFLNELTLNSDKINLIKTEENIYLLNNIFEKCFYSLILRYHNKERDQNYINQIIINLCDNINNINLNYKLNKKIEEINKKIIKKPTLDNYFFNNFNIHFKLQQIEENYQNSDTVETKYCDAFYFPNNLSLQSIDYVNLEDNITMGLFNLSEKNSPPIKLETTVLFDHDQIDEYCNMNYTLKKNNIFFEA
jgi:hypothetical protein